MIMMLADTLPVELETLDARDNPLAEYCGSLLHLDGESAVLRLRALDARGLHWGTRVRFFVDEGPLGYQIVGMIVGLQESEENDPMTGPPKCDITLRLWECRPAHQRRGTPRRRSRFAVSYLPLSATQGSTLPEEEMWLRAWCVDVGGGGMRLHLAKPLCIPERLALRFTLPLRSGEPSTSSRRVLEVEGRVLRCTAYGRRGDHIELAIKFQRLSVEDGMALSAFLAA
jgi:hypothetical protein